MTCGCLTHSFSSTDRIVCFLRIDENTLYILYMLFKTKDSGHQCPMVRIFLVVFLDITILRGIFGCEKREDLTQGRSIQGVSFKGPPKKHIHMQIEK